MNFHTVLFALSLFCAQSTLALSENSSPLVVAYQTIPNFFPVNGEEANIFRGGNPIDKGQDGITVLANLGVATIIDLQGDDVDDSLFGSYNRAHEPGEDPAMIQREKEAAESHGIRFLHLPLSSHSFPTAAAQERIRIAVETLKAATAQNPVFLHCEHGADRTGLIVALYRVQAQQWKIEQARNEWITKGHSYFSRLFTGDLDKYFYQAASLRD